MLLLLSSSLLLLLLEMIMMLTMMARTTKMIQVLLRWGLCLSYLVHWTYQNLPESENDGKSKDNTPHLMQPSFCICCSCCLIFLLHFFTQTVFRLAVSDFRPLPGGQGGHAPHPLKMLKSPFGLLHDWFTGCESPPTNIYA